MEVRLNGLLGRVGSGGVLVEYFRDLSKVVKIMLQRCLAFAVRGRLTLWLGTVGIG